MNAARSPARSRESFSHGVITSRRRTATCHAALLCSSRLRLGVIRTRSRSALPSATCAVYIGSDFSHKSRLLEIEVGRHIRYGGGSFVCTARPSRRAVGNPIHFFETVFHLLSFQPLCSVALRVLCKASLGPHTISTLHRRVHRRAGTSIPAPGHQQISRARAELACRPPLRPRG